MAKSITSDGRQDLRLIRDFPATWQIARFNLTGDAVIRNVSSSGICIELDREFPIQPGAVVLTLASSEIAELPKEARLRWFRGIPVRRGEPRKGFLCGAIFVFPETGSAERWSNWLLNAIERYAVGVPTPSSAVDSNSTTDKA